ncbi:MAG: DUF1848 domain-containing protein [Oscillospiraceae bacterium]|jgi:hypothetical protein|nr:DUF1848 domain-containing protein [Oscillospiraceae bacterium]
MIVSASRRTDIPAFYSEWLVNRLREGFALVRNPMNASQIRRVELAPESVDGFVFWTKNAAPMLPKLGAEFELLRAFPYYFQYTVTAYDTDIERGLPSKRDVVIPAFRELAARVGAERVVWRYDPILFTRRYDFDYHVRAFTRLCDLLAGSTRRCVVSFVIPYKSIAGSFRAAGIEVPQGDTRLRLIEKLLQIAAERGITLCACCESPEVYALGVSQTACVDAVLLGEIAGKPLDVKRDKNQREGCNCAASVDIGAYNTCLNGCAYCYANHGERRVAANAAAHDPKSPLLVGAVGEL